MTRNRTHDTVTALISLAAFGVIAILAVVAGVTSPGAFWTLAVTGVAVSGWQGYVSGPTLCRRGLYRPSNGHLVAGLAVLAGIGATSMLAVAAGTTTPLLIPGLVCVAVAAVILQGCAQTGSRAAA